MDLIEQFRAGRRVNTPIFAISTADQPAIQARIAAIYDEPGQDGKSTPRFRWDAIRGLRAIDKDAADWIVRESGAKSPEQLAANTGNVNACLDFIQSLPARSIIFMTNANLFWKDPVSATGVLNVRDTFKANKRTLVGTGAGFDLAASLTDSVVFAEEKLPTDAQIGTILDKIHEKASDVKKPKAEQRDALVTAARGLSAFMTEQTFAESLRKGEGLDLGYCWDRKRATFNQIPGLTLESEGPTFDDIRGLDRIRQRMEAHFRGKNPSAVIVRIDEIEKQLAGATGGDLSGTSQAALGYLLQWMEDRGATGFVALGPGGAGKSLVSKAIGRQFNRPVISFDTEATKGSLVGESGQKIRAALRGINGIAGDKPVLVVATCNKIAALPPELRRRFKMGIWFFDLPTEMERRAIWNLYLKKHGMDTDAKMVAKYARTYSNYTGAEIRNAVEMAAFESITIEEATSYVVPVAEADPDALKALRSMAHERFLNASAPGKYRIPEVQDKPKSGDRELDGEE